MRKTILFLSSVVFPFSYFLCFSFVEVFFESFWGPGPPWCAMAAQPVKINDFLTNLLGSKLVPFGVHFLMNFGSLGLPRALWLASSGKSLIFKFV